VPDSIVEILVAGSSVVEVAAGTPGAAGVGADPETIATAIGDYLTENPVVTPDATDAVKGVVLLAGDLGGTAAAPTVPGLAGKAEAEHGHDQSDVTGLVADLAGKSETGHTHTASAVTDFDTSVDARIAATRPVATDYTKTTASLADSASESGTFTLGSSQVHEALTVTADRAARVRFYATTAQRDADTARAIGTDPTGNHGLLLETVLTAGNLAYTVSPSARLFEQSAFGSVPVTITNTSGSTSTVLVTVKAKGV